MIYKEKQTNYEPKTATIMIIQMIIIWNIIFTWILSDKVIQNKTLQVREQVCPASLATPKNDSYIFKPADSAWEAFK